MNKKLANAFFRNNKIEDGFKFTSLTTFLLMDYELRRLALKVPDSSFYCEVNHRTFLLKLPKFFFLYCYCRLVVR